MLLEKFNSRKVKILDKKNQNEIKGGKNKIVCITEDIIIEDLSIMTPSIKYTVNF